MKSEVLLRKTSQIAAAFRIIRIDQPPDGQRWLACFIDPDFGPERLPEVLDMHDEAQIKNYSTSSVTCTIQMIQAVFAGG